MDISHGAVFFKLGHNYAGKAEAYTVCASAKMADDWHGCNAGSFVFLPSAEKYDAVSVMTKTTDTIKEVDSSGRILRTIDRSKLYNTQTPQGFKTELIKEAHQQLRSGNYTDDCSMLEELDIPVYIVNGSYTNIKITVKNDLDFAKIYI